MKLKLSALMALFLPIFAMAEDKLDTGDYSMDDDVYSTSTAYDTSRFGTILWWYDTF